jgi:hypothetical protein
MPIIPSPNIHPATIMIAEKASDLIARALAGGRSPAIAA